MAIDRYLLEQHRQNKHPPSLRFYTWQPAAISLGFHQQDYPPDWEHLTFQSKPLDIVRRPTGGRAVLHQGDLTYAVITSISPGKRLAVYKQICEFLISGWRSLGINLDYGNATKEYIQHSNCFATATGSDLVTPAGNKVIGSAQLRRGKSLLQHGSMILNTQPELYQKVFKTTLVESLDELVSNQKNQLTLDCDEEFIVEIIQKLTAAARATLKIDIVEQPLSTEEWEYIARHFSLLRY